MTASRLVIAVAVGLAGLIGLSGCSGVGMEPTLTKQQGLERVQQHIDDTVAAIEPAPRLERQSSNDTSTCDLPNDDGPLGRIEVSRSYWLRDIPAERNAAVFAAVERHWVDNGWVILTDETNSQDAYLWVENREDAFRMSLESSIDGQLNIGAVSPCIWPDGTPDPQPR